uniref:MSP domain-containing protein n=1 Tax=Rhabditophanes sp. KR3021 TaxID=114890 RepID=A0AC35TUX4_9BILA
MDGNEANLEFEKVSSLIPYAIQTENGLYTMIQTNGKVKQQESKTIVRLIGFVSNDEPCDEQNIQVEQLLLDSDDDSVLSEIKESEEALQLRRQEELICQMSKERDQMVHKAFIFVAAIVCIMPLGYGFTKKMAN